MVSTHKTLHIQHDSAPPQPELIDRVDHSGKSDIAPLGVITLITLARPSIDRIDQSASPGTPSL
jgi:hypothetical protein